MGRNLRLLFQRTLGLDLKIGNVANGEPARRALAHLLGDQSEHGVAHFGEVAETLQMVMVVRPIETEEIGRYDG